MTKHTILFLAANPLGTDRLALDREARAIQVELERSGFRDRFELETRWAAEPLDLLRELRKLRPTVVHFSGHGSSGSARAPEGAAGQRRDDDSTIAGQGGLYFQGADGRRQLVSAEALARGFAAAGSYVRLVVLNACYSEPQSAALVTHTGCVVGVRGSIRDDAARSFAIGFYGGLGEGESVEAAYMQGCAAIGFEGLSDADRPQLKSRPGVDAAQLVLASRPRARRPRPVAAVAAVAASPQTTVGTQPIVGCGRRSNGTQVAAPPPGDSSAEVSQRVKPPSRYRRAAWGGGTALTVAAVAAVIYVEIPTHPTLKVGSILEQYLFTSDPQDPDSPQTVRLVIKPVVDGRQGDDCFAQASETRSFASPPGNMLEEASGVFEDHYGCEQTKWNVMIRLARRPRVGVWRGWVRIALRRGNQITESEPVAVEVMTAAEVLTQPRGV